MQPTRRLVELDAMRGLAALTVFISHYFMATGADLSLAPVRPTPLGILWNGHAAVMFFFILSGFVLSLPYVNNDKPLKILEFYVKRVFRIYPAYIAAILMACVLKYGFYNPHVLSTWSSWVKTFWSWKFDGPHITDIIKSLFIIGPNFDSDMLDPAIWSLVVELKISVFIPFFIIIASRFNFMFNCLFLVITLYLNRHNHESTLYIFYAGILIAKYRSGIIESIRRLKAGSLLLLLCAGLVAYNANYELTGTQFSKSIDPADIDILLSAGSGILLCIAFATGSVKSILKKPVFGFLGEVSYSFYLIHMPILFAICSILPGGNAFSLLPVLLLSLVASLGLSYLMFKIIEMPGQAMGRWVLDKFKFFSKPMLREGAIIRTIGQPGANTPVC